jgi:uncharacterized protein YbjT (DUF2867 family)
MKVQAVITGATGMIGEGVLHECLSHPDVEKILIINRRPSGVIHPKVTEVIHSDFHNIAGLESSLSGYNACFFCMGVSSIGMKEEEFTRLTYDLVTSFAKTLLKMNPQMTFCYVSGAGTSTAEKGAMWARVKGKTENDLMKMPFKKTFMFRPGMIIPTPGLKNTLKLYRYINWMLPGLRKIFPKYVCSLREIGLAMIHSVTKGYPKSILEIPDIVALSKK